MCLKVLIGVTKVVCLCLIKFVACVLVRQLKRGVWLYTHCRLSAVFNDIDDN